ncbi:MAG TPA: GntR family transcriptional regulator [Paenibacillus cookii]|jgi:DNA-binding transcriptional regulator YhcF (GntR family)|uniref:GntR family transcriptional regulator n=1 Tax=Paenibacillus cookii TaxID=157839 RepID=A0ABQ4LY00_9BACL|nr:GntR family transcriptional regulator [Paenibacillus cookii]GIO68160.1 GntR family transcriptional regulator [Paenibacillus cookii]HWO55642.1 GntR family transcriptional regulator [Paenibacillus cookii]
MVISLQLDSDTPLYEQLRNQIVIGIATGELEPQEKLPTVRQLAEELGINTMTVNKTYSLLKQEGYIVIDRRHGAKVNPQMPGDPEPSPELEEKLQLIIAQAAIQGINESRFQTLCSQIFSKMTYNPLKPHPAE